MLCPDNFFDGIGGEELVPYETFNFRSGASVR